MVGFTVSAGTIQLPRSKRRVMRRWFGGELEEHRGLVLRHDLGNLTLHLQDLLVPRRIARGREEPVPVQRESVLAPAEGEVQVVTSARGDERNTYGLHHPPLLGLHDRSAGDDRTRGAPDADLDRTRGSAMRTEAEDHRAIPVRSTFA